MVLTHSDLLVCACAVVSGARSIDELAEWGQRASNTLLTIIGIRVNRDEFDFEPVVVLQVGGVVLSAAGLWMPFGEHQVTAVLGCVSRQFLDCGGVFDVEGQVVQPWAAAVVLFGAEGQRLLDDQVGRPEPPAAAAVTALEEGAYPRASSSQPSEASARCRSGTHSST